MAFNADMHRSYLSCLDEAELELLKAGTARCNNLEDESQLSASIFLLVRAGSLLRSLLTILVNGRLDAYEIVLRGFFEAWTLAFELRIKESQSKVAKWHKNPNKQGLADKPHIQKFLGLNGLPNFPLADPYDSMSAATHATKSAAKKSVCIASALYDPEAQASLDEAKNTYLTRAFPENMHRYIWTVVAEHPDLVSIGTNVSAMPKAMQFLMWMDRAKSQLDSQAAARTLPGSG